jgi:hypothetical protein
MDESGVESAQPLITRAAGRARALCRDKTSFCYNVAGPGVRIETISSFKTLHGGAMAVACEYTDHAGEIR